jgi:hypothetical protein
MLVARPQAAAVREVEATMGWGSVNAALNRLTREGVITGFKTNFGARGAPAGCPEILITAADVADDARAEEIRSRVAAALAPVLDEVNIIVSRSAPAGA